MTTATMFACPGCGAETAAGTERCDECRIRLTGELAMQLWRLDQQLAALRDRRLALVDLLRRDDAPVVTRPTFVTGPAAGTETRRILLVLGVVCVVGALSAATALIWPALGPGGQTALLGLVTVALLVGATRLGRLPATAEAIATTMPSIASTWPSNSATSGLSSCDSPPITDQLATVANVPARYHPTTSSQLGRRTLAGAGIHVFVCMLRRSGEPSADT